MTLSIRQKLTLTNISTAIGVLLSMTALWAVVTQGYNTYFGMQADIRQSLKVSAETKQMLDARAVKVDGQLEAIKTTVADVKTSVSVSQSNQAILSQQINQVQADLRNLTNLLLQQKTAMLSPRSTAASYDR